MGSCIVVRPTLIRGVAWLGLLIATGLLVRAEVKRPELPQGVDVHRDIVYRVSGGRRTRLDLYEPRDPAPPGGRPVIVAIHGGGWRGGNKTVMQELANRFALRGYVVAAVDYRLSRSGQPSWPENLADVRESVRWLRRHAKDYGIDPMRVVALGASAGGHLAMLLGTRDQPSRVGNSSAYSSKTGANSDDNDISGRVQAVVDMYGPSDLELLFRHSPLGSIPVELMLGGTPEEVASRYRAASPVDHVSSDDSPVLLIHGRRDALVPLEQSELFVKQLEAKGVAHRLLVIDSAKHGFHLNLAQRDLFPEVLNFLDEVWDRQRSKQVAKASH